jgi:hypothetical protein
MRLCDCGRRGLRVSTCGSSSQIREGDRHDQTYDGPMRHAAAVRACRPRTARCDSDPCRSTRRATSRPRAPGVRPRPSSTRWRSSVATSPLPVTLPTAAGRHGSTVAPPRLSPAAAAASPSSLRPARSASSRGAGSSCSRRHSGAGAHPRSGGRIDPATPSCTPRLTASGSSRRRRAGCSPSASPAGRWRRASG